MDGAQRRHDSPFVLSSTRTFPTPSTTQIASPEVLRMTCVRWENSSPSIVRESGLMCQERCRSIPLISNSEAPRIWRPKNPEELDMRRDAKHKLTLAQVVAGILRSHDKVIREEEYNAASVSRCKRVESKLVPSKPRCPCVRKECETNAKPPHGKFRREGDCRKNYCARFEQRPAQFHRRPQNVLSFKHRREIAANSLSVSKVSRA